MALTPPQGKNQPGRVKMAVFRPETDNFGLISPNTDKSTVKHPEMAVLAPKMAIFTS